MLIPNEISCTITSFSKQLERFERSGVATRGKELVPAIEGGRRGIEEGGDDRFRSFRSDGLEDRVGERA